MIRTVLAPSQLRRLTLGRRGAGALLLPTVPSCYRILATHGTLPHLLLIHFITLHCYLPSCCDLDTVTATRARAAAALNSTRGKRGRTMRTTQVLFPFMPLLQEDPERRCEVECCWGVDLCGNCQRTLAPIYLRSAC